MSSDDVDERNYAYWAEDYKVRRLSLGLLEAMDAARELTGSDRRAILEAVRVWVKYMRTGNAEALEEFRMTLEMERSVQIGPWPPVVNIKGD